MTTPATVTRWQLGQRVKSEFALVRKEMYRCDQDGLYSTECTWERKPAHLTGILIGLRSLQDGVLDADGAWNASGRVSAALIVTSLYRNPVRVPLDALEREATP